MQYLLDLLGQLNYFSVFILMTIESSFIPFPSELAMIPAGYLSSIGKMNIYLAFIFGTLGALTGSIINYLIGFKLGGKIIKVFVHKYGKYIFLNTNHYDKAEIFFQKHGNITTFNGRFIPAVRQLISIPAGIFKMNFFKFIIYTGICAGLWNIILLAIGYIAGENKELITKYSHEVVFFTCIFIVLITLVYIFLNKKRK